MKEKYIMLEKNDWRLTYQEEYLKNAKLRKKQYKIPAPRWDHDHCEFCWEKFSEYDGDLHEGYCTTDGKHWICEECFQDFKEMFCFELVDEK